MKSNETPKKIYVHKSQYWGLMANEHNVTKNGIEYTRTDSFIEEATSYIQQHWIWNAKMIEDFKNYMKGE